jgi:2-polyprenyl-3-methyl-5-hydroxy-6-metoxy-1,4-benzoquinol methylase
MTQVCEATIKQNVSPQRRLQGRADDKLSSPPTLSHTELRRSLRLRELALARRFFGTGRKLLEVGAGAGWQAKALTELGYSVTAIEISGSNYVELREFPIQEYDGKQIPAPDDSFDIIFSSNVLEHVPHISEFQYELWRVLRPHGIAVHIMPTATWRLWTNISFGLRRCMQILGRRHRYQPSAQHFDTARATPPTSRKTLRQTLLPSTHGARGNWCTEAFYFSEFFWRRTLRQEGWRLERVVKNNLFYTGHKVCGERLSLAARSLLSRFLGSSCKVYVLRKVAQHEDKRRTLLAR